MILPIKILQFFYLQFNNDTYKHNNFNFNLHVYYFKFN